MERFDGTVCRRHRVMAARRATSAWTHDGFGASGARDNETSQLHSIEITDRRVRGSNEIAYLTANYETTFSSERDPTLGDLWEAICGYCESALARGLLLSWVGQWFFENFRFFIVAPETVSLALHWDQCSERERSRKADSCYYPALCPQGSDQRARTFRKGCGFHLCP